MKGYINMQLTFKNELVHIAGDFIKVGDTIPEFTLVNSKLEDKALSDFEEKLLLLNIFPSVDTEVCADSVRTFNLKAGEFNNSKVLCISKDLPFAQTRFCGATNINNVEMLSAFRSPEFGKSYGVEITSGLIRGLLARAVIVVNSERQVIYTELVSEITNKPNYEKCLAAMEKYK